MRVKCFLGISNFLEEISSLSHFIVFLYFFALITEEGFLISPCYSLELCIQIGISFFSSLLFASLLFTAFHSKPSSVSHFAFLHFFFLGMVLKRKKAFLSDQCKEIEENNRMGKTRDLFKKVGDTKGTFHVFLCNVRSEEHTSELQSR